MAVTFTQLNQLYLAYFGRPVDYNGFIFFTNNPASTVDTVAAAFNSSPESQALFGGNAVAQVTAIYRNLFNRDPELGGLTFWTGQIAKGILSAPQAAIVILNAAVGTDATSVSNKLGAALSFFNAMDTVAEVNGYAGTAAAASARAFLAGVSDVAATVPTQAAVDAALANAIGTGSSNPGQTFTLTLGVDTINGTTGNDTIEAVLGNDANGNSAATLTPLDEINGNAGTDTINIHDITGGQTAAGVTVKNVEVANLASAGSADINTSTWTGLNTLNVTQGTGANVTAGATTAVAVSGVTGAVVVDGGSSIGVAAATANAAVTVGATTVPAGAVTITHTKEGTGAINVDGGTDVTVTASGVTTGSISIGQGGASTDLPSGAVKVTSTGAASVAATDVTLGTINISGGSTVTVSQTASSSSAAAAKDAIGATITQSAVNVTGGPATTAVTVTQSAPAAEVLAVAAVAGSKETNVITFSALKAGQDTSIGGLVFTAAKDLTAAQVAAAYANLAAGATQGSAPAGNGIYSGALVAGWTSGAVVVNGTAQTVTVSSTKNVDAVDLDTIAGTIDMATVVTQGVTAVDAVTGVLGVAGGAVAVNGQITGADVLASAALAGYASATVKSDALATLSLANSNGAVTVTNATATTLALSLSGVGTQLAGAAAAIDLGATYTTLNLAASGADNKAAITAGGVTAITISGDKAVDLTGSVMGALKTATVTGAAGVTADVSAVASLTAINASGTSGNNTVTFDATKATYTGGSGVDKVTVAGDVGKAIDLGAGDDSLTLANNNVNVAVTGGAGTDTLVMTSANAELASASGVFETKIDSFEKLSLGAVVGAVAPAVNTDTIDLANMDDISYVISAGGAAQSALVLNNMGAGGTLELTGAAISTQVNLVDATGKADVLNVITKVGTADINFGTVDLPGVETVNLTATDTSTKAAINTATLTLKDAAVTALTATGNANLTVVLDANVKALASFNASGLTGNLTASTNGTVAETITGGSGNDALTAIGTSDTLVGGAGNDTLNVRGNSQTITGGAGADVFNVDFATVNVNSYATITDLASGDKIQFNAGAANFVAAKTVLGDTAVFQDFANAAINATNAGDVAWFQFGGNTYVVENVNDGVTFLNGTDMIVKIAGLVDLSTASFSASADTLLIA